MRKADFLSYVMRNPVHDVLLRRINEIGLPDAWIVAGCLTQTVWNVVTGRKVDYGINDYDVFYFDHDLSWDAEDRVIRAFRDCAELSSHRIEVRNQARVHLWYPEKHSKPYPALFCATEGIDRFQTRCTQTGVSGNGADVSAPAGLEDIEALIVRPNLTQNFDAEVYRTKSTRWQALWPELTILPPPDCNAESPPLGGVAG